MSVCKHLFVIFLAHLTFFHLFHCLRSFIVFFFQNYMLGLIIVMLLATASIKDHTTNGTQNVMCNAKYIDHNFQLP